MATQLIKQPNTLLAMLPNIVIAAQNREHTILGRNQMTWASIILRWGNEMGVPFIDINELQKVDEGTILLSFVDLLLSNMEWTSFTSRL